MIKLMIILGQSRLSKGCLYPTGLEKELGQGTTGLKPLAGVTKRREKFPKTIFKSPRSSIKPESAPGPKKILPVDLKEFHRTAGFFGKFVWPAPDPQDSCQGDTNINKKKYY